MHLISYCTHACYIISCELWIVGGVCTFSIVDLGRYSIILAMVLLESKAWTVGGAYTYIAAVQILCFL